MRTIDGACCRSATRIEGSASSIDSRRESPTGWIGSALGQIRNPMMLWEVSYFEVCLGRPAMLRLKRDQGRCGLRHPPTNGGEKENSWPGLQGAPKHIRTTRKQ